jgi:hypothetical protein
MEVSGQLHALAALSPGKESPVPIGWEAGGGGTRAVLDSMEKRKIPYLYRESNPAVQHVARRYTD